MENEEFTHRREFFIRSAKAVVAFGVGGTAFNAAAGSQEVIQPELMIFPDDGVIPNSRYPLLLFRNPLRTNTTISGSEWRISSPRTTGQIVGRTESTRCTTITALLTKCLGFLADPRRCG